MSVLLLIYLTCPKNQAHLPPKQRSLALFLPPLEEIKKKKKKAIAFRTSIVNNAHRTTFKLIGCILKASATFLACSYVDLNVMVTQYMLLAART